MGIVAGSFDRTEPTACKLKSGSGVRRGRFGGVSVDVLDVLETVQLHISCAI